MNKRIKTFPSGQIKMPPSKSDAHRAVICAGLSHGGSVVRNIALSEDIEATINCMQGLGAEIALQGDMLMVLGGLKRRSTPLFCGESGSTLRFMLPIAATMAYPVTLTGKPGLMRRPMGPLLRALEKAGASVSQGDAITVRGPVRPGEYELPGDISSQYVSGLLFALPLLGGDSVIKLTTPLQSTGYVDMTLSAMADFGVNVENHGYSAFHIPGNQVYMPRRYTVEADYSQAAFFLCAGALGCDCEALGLRSDSKQGDRKILDILTRSGVKLSTGPHGGIIARADALSAQVVDVSDIPDLVPPLAALLCFADGESRIVNASRLRIKESDRLSTVTRTLNALGADITEQPDELIIRGVKTLRGGIADSHNDHRIAMMAALAAVRTEGTVEVLGAECVAKSYPNFWDKWA